MQETASPAGVEVRNWGGDIVSRPKTVVKARSVDDIVTVMKNPDKYPAPVRAIGSNHSTTRCATADGGTIVEVGQMTDIIEIGEDFVTTQAGALYIDVARKLQEHNLQFFVNVELGNLTIGSACCGGTKDASMPDEFGPDVFDLGSGSAYVGLEHLAHPPRTLSETERGNPFVEPNRSVVFRHRQAASKQGHFIADLRRVYQNHPKLDQLKRFLVPIYRGHLETYERNLNRLIDLAQSEGVGLLLATQPLNFSANDRAGTDQRSRSEKFWIAYSAKPEGFVPSPTLIAKLLGDFNDATRRIAETRGVPLVDLASALANCSDCFYDQWHLTVSGAGREGTMIADALLREGLLVRRGRTQR